MSLFRAIGMLRRSSPLLHIHGSEEVVEKFRELFEQNTGLAHPQNAKLSFSIDTHVSRYTRQEGRIIPTSFDPSIRHTAPVESLAFYLDGHRSAPGGIAFDRYTFKVEAFVPPTR